MATVPTRQTTEAALDQWNRALRQSPLYQNFLKKHGLFDTGRGVTLSKSQQAALEGELAAAGTPIPPGMHIDAGGNLNQKNTLKKNIAIGAAIGGAALTGFGAAGIGPLAGLGGAGAAAGGAGAAGVGAGAGGAAAGGAAAAGAGIGSWLAPVLNYGVPAVTGLLGQRMQANADRDAAGLQYDYLNRALDEERENKQYTRAQQADYLARLKPYEQAGTAAVGRASDFLSRYQPQAPPMGGSPGEPMVALKDSRGVIKQVPASQAEQFIRQGAQRA